MHNRTGLTYRGKRAQRDGSITACQRGPDRAISDTRLFAIGVAGRGRQRATRGLAGPPHRLARLYDISPPGAGTSELCRHPGCVGMGFAAIHSVADRRVV